MGIRFRQTFHSRRYTDGKLVHEILTSLFIREMQTNTTSYHCTPTRMAEIEDGPYQVLARMWRNLNSRVRLMEVWNYTNTSENSSAFSQKVTHTSTMSSSHSTSIPPEDAKADIHTKTCAQMLIAALFGNSSRLETTQMSLMRGLDKQIIIYPYDVIVLSHKKKWTSK